MRRYRDRIESRQGVNHIKRGCLTSQVRQSLLVDEDKNCKVLYLLLRPSSVHGADAVACFA